MTATNASLASSAYYVIGYSYAGPNPDQNRNFDHFDISTVSAVKNLSREPIENGWAGTTNDISCNARGRFDTLDEAREAVLGILGDDFRKEKPTDFDTEFDGVVERYRVNQRDLMTASDSVDWCRETVREVGIDTTDAEIEEKLDLCVRDNDDHGGDEIDRDAVLKAMRERREELILELADDDCDEEDDAQPEYDAIQADVDRHDAENNLFLDDRKAYFSAAETAGGTVQRSLAGVVEHVTIDTDAEGEVLQSGDMTSVWSVTLYYRGRRWPVASVARWISGSDVTEDRTYEYQPDDNTPSESQSAYESRDPVADVREAVEFATRVREEEEGEDDYENRCDSMAGASVDRDYD